MRISKNGILVLNKYTSNNKSSTATTQFSDISMNYKGYFIGNSHAVGIPLHVKYKRNNYEVKEVA